jgi:flagellar biogenesis protein FliO
LQAKQHQEILVKQEQGFFKQKLELVSGFFGVVAVMIGAFIYFVKKLKEAKQEVKELLKK